MPFDQEKLAKAFAALWVFSAIPISQDVYDAEFDGGLLMRIFVLALVSAPVWLVFGWRWVTNKMSLPLKYWGFIAVSGAIVSIIFANSYNYDEVAYVPLVSVVAFLVMVWIYERGAIAISIKKLIKISSIAPPSQNGLGKVTYVLEEGARFRDITKTLQKEILKQLDFNNALQNIEHPINPSVDAYLACYGLVYFYISTLPDHQKERVSEIFPFYKLEIGTILGEEKAEYIKKILPKDVKLSADIFKDPEYKKSIEDLMNVFEARAGQIKTRGSYYPIYEKLKIYSSKDTTEEALRNKWEPFFSRLYSQLEKKIFS